MNLNPADIQIGGNLIGFNHRPIIIAEMSGNHNHSLERALEIVEAAAIAGVDALKIQTYTADTMTLNIHEGSFVINDPQSLWHGKSFYDLYEEAHTPWEWHQPIFERCRELGIIGFSTPFDETAVNFLESLDVPCYKIASFELVDLALLREIASTGKPVILSTGMATVEELNEAIQTLRNNGCTDLILLKCTSTYPASPADSNIATIPHMRELFTCQVGLSDHTHGIGVALAAITMGATVIEKHFTLSRKDGGVDAPFSMEPEEMKALVNETQNAWLAKGSIQYGPNEKEEKSMHFRRSLYVAQNMKAGNCFTRENIRAIRPGDGLHPRHMDEILGMKAKRNIKIGEPLSWDMID